MIALLGSLQASIGRAAAPEAVRGRVGAPWRVLLGAAASSLAIGLVISHALTGQRPVPLPTAHQRTVPRAGLLRLPLAAQAPASNALGADNSAYRVSASSDGLRAGNPAQRLQESFDSSGVVVASADTHVGLRLSAVAFDSFMLPLGSVSPQGRSNRVTYTYPGLSEWYANGPLGIEQGFTLQRSLTGHPTDSVMLSIALSGNVRASLARDGHSVTFSHAGGPTLRYGGLVATDARRHKLHSSLELRDGVLALRVFARGATYPIRVDPFIQQGNELTGAEEIGNGAFGDTVALSSDGNTALIGGRYDNHFAGAAWVFTRSGETWSQQGPKLTGTGESGEAEFGWSIALSPDGNTALIGAPGDSSLAGAAWVFTRSGSTWTQQGSKLTGGAEESGKGEFGYSVALSSDGNIGLIGGVRDNSGKGAVWVVTRSGEAWSQQGSKLTGGGEVALGGIGYFGYRVALSASGDTALIGGIGDTKSTGAAWAFTRSGSTWTQQGEKLTGSGEILEGQFGSSVALSTDGDTALIGGFSDNSYVGAAWVFTRFGETWSQQGAKLTGAGESGEGYFGTSVALSSDGDAALIGGTYDNSGRGAAWVFARSGSAWTQQGAKLTEAGVDNLGNSVALSSDARTALLGGPLSFGQRGAAWVFAPPPPQAPCTALTVQTTALAPATPGTAYSQTLEACRGTPPYKWKRVGRLPKGLKLSKAGVLAGTPSTKIAAGSYPIGVRVTDSEKPKRSASATLMLTIK